MPPSDRSGEADPGARLSFTIVPGMTTYTGCFENVSSFTAGHDFNTLRVEFASSDIPGLQGTTNKSASFAPCTSPTPTPSGTPTPTPSGTPTPRGTPTPTPTPTPSGSPTATPTATPPPGATPTPGATPSGGGGLGGGLAQTGGFQFGFLLAGLVLLVAGMSVLGVTLARSRSTRP